MPFSPPIATPGRTALLPLIKVAVGRSGDKGDSANVAFIARSDEAYRLLKEQVTEATVRDVLGHLIDEGGHVQRYDVPGVKGINFVISKCLGGGGLKSIRFDKQVSRRRRSLSASRADPASSRKRQRATLRSASV